MKKTISLILTAALAAALSFCGEKKPVDEQAALLQQGKVVYFSFCTACHNQDPSVDGNIGPAIRGSSRELIEARVLRMEYPAGYKPKRPSKIMQKIPLTPEQISAVAAFLK